MKQSHAGVCALALLLLVSLMGQLPAQTAAVTTGAARPFAYDPSEEVTFSGTASSVLQNASAEMIPGAHLLITTLSGPLDASLGTFAFRGKGALVVSVGQQVEITGVVKTVKDKPVLLVRTVKVGGHIYPIRNEHGVQLSPPAREHASLENAQKGETR
jgi:hypothetical protein